MLAVGLVVRARCLVVCACCWLSHVYSLLAQLCVLAACSLLAQLCVLASQSCVLAAGSVVGRVRALLSCTCVLAACPVMRVAWLCMLAARSVACACCSVMRAHCSQCPFVHLCSCAETLLVVRLKSSVTAAKRSERSEPRREKRAEVSDSDGTSGGGTSGGGTSGGGTSGGGMAAKRIGSRL